MVWFRDVPIDRKLKIIIMTVSAAACAAVCIVLIALAVKIYRDEQLASLKGLSAVVSRNVEAALAFDLPEDARDMLSSIKEMRNIAFAGVYDINGNLFAYYRGKEGFVPPERPDFHGYEIRDGMLYFYRPIVRGNRILGSVCIVDDMYLIRRVTRRTLLVFLIVLALVLGVTYLTAFHLQKLISVPLKEFTAKANTIAEKQDYTVRMDYEPKDELGILAAAFNVMLSRIEAQSEELEEANANLEERVRERTTELKEAQEKLLRTQKLALVGELAGSIAHELRTPLGVLKNAAYYLRLRLSKMTDDEKIMRHLEIIEDEIVSSDRIITDVLTFARVKRPDLSEEDMNDIVRESMGKMRIADNISVELDLKEPLPRVYADRNQLVQVFCNLITNAVQSMPEGGELKIETGKVSHFVFTHVKDTGTGISRENIRKIFEPLFSTKVKGTGLGLSTCNSLVSLHNGKLEVESTVGVGSVFTVKLPFLASEEGQALAEREGDDVRDTDV